MGRVENQSLPVYQIWSFRIRSRSEMEQSMVNFGRSKSLTQSYLVYWNSVLLMWYFFSDANPTGSFGWVEHV